MSRWRILGVVVLWGMSAFAWWQKDYSASSLIALMGCGVWLHGHPFGKQEEGP